MLGSQKGLNMVLRNLKMQQQCMTKRHTQGVRSGARSAECLECEIISWSRHGLNAQNITNIICKL